MADSYGNACLTIVTTASSNAQGLFQPGFQSGLQIYAGRTIHHPVWQKCLLSPFYSTGDIIYTLAFQLVATPNYTHERIVVIDIDAVRSEAFAYLKKLQEHVENAKCRGFNNV